MSTSFILPKPKKKFSTEVHPVPTVIVTTTEYEADYSNLDPSGNPSVVSLEKNSRIKLRGFGPDKDSAKFAAGIIQKYSDNIPPSAEPHLVKLLDRLKIKVQEASDEKHSQSLNHLDAPFSPTSHSSVSPASSISAISASTNRDEPTPNIARQPSLTTLPKPTLRQEQSPTHPPKRTDLSTGLSTKQPPPASELSLQAFHHASSGTHASGQPASSHYTFGSPQSSSTKVLSGPSATSLASPVSRSKLGFSSPLSPSAVQGMKPKTTRQASSDSETGSPTSLGDAPPNFRSNLGLLSPSAMAASRNALASRSLSKSRRPGPFGAEMAEGTTLSFLNRLNLPENVSIDYLDSYVEALYCDDEDEQSAMRRLHASACILQILQEGDVDTLLLVSQTASNALSASISLPSIRDSQPDLCCIVLEIFYAFSSLQELQPVVLEKKIGASAIAIISTELHRVELQSVRIAMKQRENNTQSLNEKQTSALANVLQTTDKLLFVALYLLFNLCVHRGIETAIATKLTPLLYQILLKDIRMYSAISSPHTFCVVSTYDPTLAGNGKDGNSNDMYARLFSSHVIDYGQRIGDWAWQSACAPQLSILVLAFLRRLASLPSLPPPSHISPGSLGTIQNKFFNRVLSNMPLLHYCSFQLRSTNIATVAATLRLLYNITYSIPLLLQQLAPNQPHHLVNVAQPGATSTSTPTSTSTSASASTSTSTSQDLAGIAHALSMSNISREQIDSLVNYFHTVILPALIDLLNVPNLVQLAARVLYLFSTSINHKTYLCDKLRPHILWLAKTALDSAQQSGSYPLAPSSPSMSTMPMSPSGSNSPRIDTEICALLINMVTFDRDLAMKLLNPQFMHIIINKVSVSHSIMRVKLLRILSEYPEASPILAPFAFDIANMATKILHGSTFFNYQAEDVASKANMHSSSNLIQIDLYSLELLGVLGNIDELSVDWFQICVEYDLHQTLINCLSLLYVQQQHHQDNVSGCYDDIVLQAVILAGVVVRNYGAALLLCQSVVFLELLTDIANYGYSINDLEIVQQVLFVIGRVLLHRNIRENFSFSDNFCEMLLHSVSNDLVSIRTLSNVCIDTIIEIDHTNLASFELLKKRFENYNYRYLDAVFPNDDFSTDELQ